MSMNCLPPLRIGDLEVAVPIIQGGMGVRVSRANLASAVANAGGIGIIAAVGLGKFEDLPGSQFVKVNDEALRTEIRRARELTSGVIGVNAMVALSNYENLVRVAVEEKIDLIISGAGLPLDLPKFTAGTPVKLLPIVSSAKALRIICKKWEKNYGRLPDAVVVEGPKAGGHLGYSFDALESEAPPQLASIVTDIISLINDDLKVKIPVIVAGGVFNGEDIARYLKLGASGVQIGTRFVCTDECDVHFLFKKSYLDAEEKDLVIIKSPVGMPGRVIKNSFVEKVLAGHNERVKCEYRCLKTCDPATAPYCIAKALAYSAEGKMDKGIVFAGANAHLCDEIIPVKTLMERLKEETLSALGCADH